MALNYKALEYKLVFAPRLRITVRSSLMDDEENINLQYEKNVLNLGQRNRNCYVGDAEISLMNDFAFDMGLLSFYFFGFY